MSFGLRFRLSAMMFLQYAVWSLWLPVLYQFMNKTDGVVLTANQQGWIFTVYGFGAIIGPFLLGQIADRYLSTEYVLAIAHAVGGVLLIFTAYATSFWGIFGLLFLYCNLYMPTMGLSNSITFRSLGEAHQEAFPGIRVWGTIGWIVSSMLFSAYLDYRTLDFFGSLFHLVGLDGLFRSFLGWWTANIIPMLEPWFALSWVGQPKFRDCMRGAGLLSLVYSLYCLTLPHTPPTPVASDRTISKRSAVRESLELMRFPSFAVLVVVTGLIGIMLAFYFACENPFLESIKIPENQTGAYMTIGQIAEIVCMVLVPPAVARFGVKNTMLLGAGAWALRFGLSAIGHPLWLMVATIALHGFAFGFFFVVAQMYVDRAASGDIKATAQNLLVFVIYGIGTIVGSVITGPIKDYFTRSDKTLNWQGIWMGPFVLTLFSILIFALFFRDRELTRAVPLEAIAEGE